MLNKSITKSTTISTLEVNLKSDASCDASNVCFQSWTANF